AFQFLYLRLSTVRTWARKAAVPEVVAAFHFVRTRPGRRALLQTRLLDLFFSLWTHLPSLTAVQGPLCVPVIHELFVRTAASVVVSVSARLQSADRAQAKPQTGPGPKSRRPCSAPV